MSGRFRIGLEWIETRAMNGVCVLCSRGCEQTRSPRLFSIRSAAVGRCGFRVVRGNRRNSRGLLGAPGSPVGKFWTCGSGQVALAGHRRSAVRDLSCMWTNKIYKTTRVTKGKHHELIYRTGN